MFSKTKKKSRDALVNEKKAAPPSIISGDMRITGDIVSEGEVQIDGNVEGDVVCRSLTVGTTGTIKGEVEVDTARLHGTMIGQLRARSVFLANTARMVGDITHESLAIEPGAYVDGHCRHMEQIEHKTEAAALMLSDASAKKPEPETTPEPEPVPAAARQQSPAQVEPAKNGGQAKTEDAGTKPAAGSPVNVQQGQAKGDRSPREAIKGALSGAG